MCQEIYKTDEACTEISQGYPAMGEAKLRDELLDKLGLSSSWPSNDCKENSWPKGLRY